MNENQMKALEKIKKEAEENNWNAEQIMAALNEAGIELPANMEELTPEEMEQVNGGFLGFLLPIFKSVGLKIVHLIKPQDEQNKEQNQ